MYQNRWTAELVLDRLVEAFRQWPEQQVYAPPPMWRSDGPVDGLSLIAATGVYLGYRTPRRRQLLLYARARAVGITVTDLARAEGWPRSSLYRQVRVSAQIVASGLVSEAMNRASAKIACE